MSDLLKREKDYPARIEGVASRFKHGQTKASNKDNDEMLRFY